MRFIFPNVVADPAYWITFLIAQIVLFGVGRWICRNNQETFESYWFLMIVAPVVFGLVGANSGSILIGFAIAALITLFTTTFFGDLSLRTSLLLTMVNSTTVGLAILVANQFVEQG